MLLYAIINHGIIHPFNTLGYYYILLLDVMYLPLNVNLKVATVFCSSFPIVLHVTVKLILKDDGLSSGLQSIR